MPRKIRIHQSFIRSPRVKKTANERGYDAAWRKLRMLKLTNDPFCQCDDCVRDERLVRANVVDHILPIAERPDLRLDYDNLRSMLKAHHDRHTMLVENAKRKRTLTNIPSGGRGLTPSVAYKKPRFQANFSTKGSQKNEHPAEEGQCQ